MPSVLDWQQWFLFRVNKVVFFNRWSHKIVTSDTTVSVKHAEQSQQKMWPFMRGRALRCTADESPLPSVRDWDPTRTDYIIHWEKKQCAVLRSFERKTILVIKAGIIYSERTLYSRPDRRVFKIDVRKLAYFEKRVQIVAHGLSELTFIWWRYQ